MYYVVHTCIIHVHVHMYYMMLANPVAMEFLLGQDIFILLFMRNQAM